MTRRSAPERLRGLPSRLLNLAAGYAQRQVGERLATLDSRKWHYATLAALEEFGPDSQSGLSDRTGIYRSDLVATINELTARGLVVRAPDPADRRRNAITLTDEGRRHLKQLDATDSGRGGRVPRSPVRGRPGGTYPHPQTHRRASLKALRGELDDR